MYIYLHTTLSAVKHQCTLVSAWRGHAVVMLTGRGSEDNCRVVSGQPRHSGVLHCRWSCVKHGHSQTWDQGLTRYVMDSTILGESTRPTFREAGEIRSGRSRASYRCIYRTKPYGIRTRFRIQRGKYEEMIFKDRDFNKKFSREDLQLIDTKMFYFLPEILKIRHFRI